MQRRRSEGNDPNPPVPPHQRQHQYQPQRRTSFDSAGSLENVNGSGVQRQGNEDRIVRCRNSKCTNQASLLEARRTYKSCHNCTCLYCSRECRRAHWNRHKRTCLYSRANSLCIQVLSSVKKDPTTSKQVSLLARRGFLAQGRGAVKCFFASPEAAEKFIQFGFQELVEPTYVKWGDIVPSEMGTELYAEACKLCESYNPETRMVVYLSVCVVREVPGTGGTVMWERQPVSRCAKLKLEASCRPQPATSSSTSAVASPQQQRAHTASPGNITKELEFPDTVLFTSKPKESGVSTKESREIIFENIQRLLQQRGVSLRRHFPTVLGKLRAYVDGSVEKLAPITIFPKDQASNQNFMVIIMLEAEPDTMKLLPVDSSEVRIIDVGNTELD